MANRKELVAGRLHATYTDGALRYIRLGGTEVLRHIYMAVRDGEWNTIPATLSNERLTATEGSFEISFDAEHRQDDIWFRWHCTMKGSHDRIEVAMDGAAETSFLKNRIGFCVLHPTRECAGRPCTVGHHDGSSSTAPFPDLISPHQPFLNVRSMTHEVAPGIRSEVSFEGDIFETEDQRNWTDDSFKTYSTPLALPFPARVEKGHRVRQRVVLELLQDRLPLPKIGFGWSGRLPGDLRPDHIRVDVRPSDPGWQDTLAQARSTGIPLEVALYVTSADDLAALEIDNIARVIVYDTGRAATTVETARAAVARFGDRAGAGSNANFAELNRNRDGALAAGFLAFSANAQVHGTDDLTVIETIAGQAAAVRTARAFGNGKPVVVSPVTLIPRSNAVAADPRQTGPFNAAWTLASIASLAEAGAASITWFETAGPRGIVDANGNPYAVYHVFEAITSFQPDGFLPYATANPLESAGLVLTRGSARRTLVANLTPPYGVTWTDE